MPVPSAIRLQGVVKRFGDLVAVDSLDLEIPTGICFGLLGPNGAGKSTTMRLLTGQAVADRGEVMVLGHPMPAESKAARARCGTVPQADNLDDELTVAENLGVYARLYGVPTNQREAAVRRGLELARLVDRAQTNAAELSGGMRRRLLIARGLMHAPELVLLDEPTVGLDPQIRQQLWTQIAAVRAEGATVVITTHYIEEAQRLCDEVAVMHAGRVVARGRPADLIASIVGPAVIEIPGDAATLAGVVTRAHELGLRTRAAGTTVVVFGRTELDGIELGGGPPSRRPGNLEDVFVLLTGEELT